MKSTGIVRKVDELGRIVLPIELRRTLNVKFGAVFCIQIPRLLSLPQTRVHRESQEPNRRKLAPGSFRFRLAAAASPQNSEMPNTARTGLIQTVQNKKTVHYGPKKEPSPP